MENLKKHLNVAIVEFSRLQFSGAAVVPAGRVMQALCFAIEEVNKKAEEEKKRAKEETENVEG